MSGGLGSSILLKSPIDGAPSFTWHEAVYLHSWEVHALPDPIIEANIIKFASQLQKVRDILDEPMIVTNWWRPRKYNLQIGGALKSHHMTGGACDFVCPYLRPNQIRTILRDHLEDLDLRMENLVDSTWVHLDNKVTKGARFFRP